MSGGKSPLAQVKAKIILYNKKLTTLAMWQQFYQCEKTEIIDIHNNLIYEKKCE